MGKPLGAEVDELMVGPVVNKLAGPIVEVEEQIVSLVMDMEGDLAMLFGGDDNSGDDDSEGPEDDEEVWSASRFMYRREIWRGHGQLVEKVIMVSDAEVADGIAIEDIGPRVSTVEDQMQVMAFQMVQVCILGMDRRLAALERRSPGP
ncbi:hypothetical protein Tco_0910391 [Tanacetum coccineum]|uniref:Uncharacterized protein n=1 Tax=Tanacetum coccineum TaxID=301880 RepID=A0ABQ5CSQ4_9ASTR